MVAQRGRMNCNLGKHQDIEKCFLQKLNNNKNNYNNNIEKKIKCFWGHNCMTRTRQKPKHVKDTLKRNESFIDVVRKKKLKVKCVLNP